MEPAPAHAGKLVETSKRFARRLFTIGENRFQLLMVAVQEERERSLHAILLALCVPAFGLLAGVALTALRRGPPTPGTPKSSWFKKMLEGARVASAIWFAFRARGRQEERQSAPTKPEACRVGGGLRPQHFGTIMFGLLLLVGCFTSAQRLAGEPLISPMGRSEANSAPESPGPTLRLDYGRGESLGNPVAEFMFFVPLISPEPVSILMSPGNTQRARMVSATRSFTARLFLVTCEFEFVGEGNQQEVLDHTEKIRRHERELKEGGTLDHQLSSINVEGAGNVRIEVTGTMTDRVPTVTEVRLRFNGRGQPSPVTIGLHDIRYMDGSFRLHNESVARVNTLVFRRKSGPSKMDITVASVKRKDASNSFLQNLMGGLKGTTVNLFMPPIAVERAGCEAMLNFGLALALEAPAFTFPRAKNLKTGGGPSHLSELRPMEFKPGDTARVSGSMNLRATHPSE